MTIWRFQPRDIKSLLYNENYVDIFLVLKKTLIYPHIWLYRRCSRIEIKRSSYLIITMELLQLWEYIDDSMYTMRKKIGDLQIFCSLIFGSRGLQDTNFLHTSLNDIQRLLQEHFNRLEMKRQLCPLFCSTIGWLRQAGLF